MVESVDDFLRSSLGLSEGAFSFCLEGMDFRLLGEEEEKEV